MLIYHGTSFENACNILSKKYFEYPVEFYLKGEYEVNKLIGKCNYFHKDWINELGNHFTTSLKHAKTYALQHNKPVVLFFDHNLFAHNTIPSFDFIISKPIPTDIIKCIEVRFKGEQISYGILCNVLYNKKLNNNFRKELIYLNDKLSEKSNELLKIKKHGKEKINRRNDGRSKSSQRTG
jgi:hypothetical protein